MENSFNIQQVREFWDDVGRNYEKYHEKEDVGESHFQRFKVAVPYLFLGPGDRILNIWSRTGEAIPFLRKRQQNLVIHNLEVSSEFIKVAREHFPLEQFEQTDLEKLPFHDQYFDAILSLETLEHVPKPSVYLSELFRVLKPGRQLVMSVPSSVMEWPMRLYQAILPDHGEGPHKFLYPTTVKRLLTEAGFYIEIHKGTLLLPAGPKILRRAAERFIEICRNTPIRNIGLRQFYVCRKPKE